MSPILETARVQVLREARPVVSFDEANDLAERHGSPLMVYSRSAVVRNYETMRSYLPGVEIFYAAKANPHSSILRPLAELGSSVDVCSYREAVAALDAGFAPETMLHTHPCKTIANLRDCYDLGIRWFVYDNALELGKMATHAADANLLLRLAMPAASSHINLSAKFGAALPDALGLMREADRQGLAVRGISFHVGSQCTSPGDFRSALRRAREIWDQGTRAGIPLEVLDIGGGFPAPYRESVMSLDEYCSNLARSLDETFGDLPIRIVAEPGRGISADTASLITRVIGKSFRNGMWWYIIDDGLYGSFSGIVFDHVQFPLMARGADSRDLFPCIVAGPTCDSSDVVSRDQLLPELEVGELLLVPTMGAYTSASASNFNGLDMAQSIDVE